MTAGGQQDGNGATGATAGVSAVVAPFHTWTNAVPLESHVRCRGKLPRRGSDGTLSNRGTVARTLRRPRYGAGAALKELCDADDT